MLGSTNTLTTLLLLATCLSAGACGVTIEEERFGAGFEVPTEHVADPTDVESIDAIITALYDVISGPAGPRDWARDRTLYHPDAGWHMPIGPRRDGQEGTMVRVLSLEEYQQQAAGYFDENGFYEIELARRVERFGHIAQVFSTYESRHALDDAEPFARGINSIQLMFDGTRWWVLSISWDSEREGQAIPGRYLKNGEKR
jgi:hypothetical protein